MIVAHIGEVEVLTRFDSEAVLRLPQIGLAPFKYQMPVIINQSISIVVLDLFAPRIEEQGFAKRIAKTYISKPSLFQLNKQSHVIERRIETPFIARDSCRQHRDFKTQRSQQDTEGAVQFVTDTAAPFLNDFADHFFFIENDLAAGMVVEVFKRHR